MKLTGKLKEQVEQAGDKAEAKEMIAEAGMELADKELDQAAGGMDLGSSWIEKGTSVYLL
ncbi:MAG: hypothetical protein E7300_00260 [Lachnospiraceae bacterium]|nr:hypothetical protein [Lachnospiraceae bacterium]